MISLAFCEAFTERLFDFIFFNYTEVGNGGASRRQLCTIISKLETWKEISVYLPRHQIVHTVDAKPLTNMGTGMTKTKSIQQIY